MELWHAGRRVAQHERCYGRQHQILDLERYHDVLYRKPGAMAGSMPLQQMREAGLGPESFDRMWRSSPVMERSGTRPMVGLLKAAQKHGGLVSQVDVVAPNAIAELQTF